MRWARNRNESRSLRRLTASRKRESGRDWLGIGPSSAVQPDPFLLNDFSEEELQDTVGIEPQKTGP